MRVDVDAFETMYRRDGDPWDFSSSAYEQRRYAVTLASLERERYERCFEPGCSIGVLTQMLAERCGNVVACDASTTAIGAANERLADRTNVELHAATIPEWWPTGQFDLIVCSELGYYWDEDALAGLVNRLVDSIVPDGELIAVHWLGTSPDHLLHGTVVHRVLGELLGASALRHEDPSGFLLERWRLA